MYVPLTLIVLFILLLVAAVGLGFYQGWFKLSFASDKANSNVTLSVDKDKMGTDKDSAVDKAQELGHKAVDSLGPHKLKD